MLAIKNLNLDSIKEKFFHKHALQLIVYRIFLEVLYVSRISPIYSYTDFCVEPTVFRYLLSIILFILFIPIISSYIGQKKPSKVMILVWYIIVYIPALILIAYKPTPPLFILLFVLYWLFFYLFDTKIPYFKLKIGKSEIKTYLFYLVLVMMVFTVMYISYRFTGFRLNFNIFEAYDLRAESTTFKLGSTFRYLLSFSRTVLPVYFIYFLHKRNYLIVIGLVAVQLFSYSIDGSKSVLFALGLSAIVYFIYHDKMLSSILKYFNLLNGAALFESFVLNRNLIVGVVIRRVHFVPQLLNYYYFDYFLKNPIDLFRSGIVGRLGFPSPYQESIPRIIGRLYAKVTAANNGLFSDAFSNLGYLGIVIMPFVIVIILRVLDSVAEGINFRITLPSLILMCFVFVSSSFFTIMMTHGFIMIVLVLFLMPREVSKEVQ